MKLVLPFASLAVLVTLSLPAQQAGDPELKARQQPDNQTEQKQVPKVVPAPFPKARGGLVEPASPPAQTVEDARTHVTLRLPSGWNMARKDGELSTFHLDARTAPHTAQLRVVATIAFNPYPQSTFSGALFYLSTTPHSTVETCAAQARAKPNKPLATLPVADIPFTRGLDEHGHICTESRDVTYTAMREGSCLRFDLAVNTFCGGEVSGARDMSDAELASVFRRLEDILNTVQFSVKD